MQRAWRIAGAAFALVSVVWAYESWQLSLKDALGPGPGFFPFCLSLAGAALAVVLMVRGAPPPDNDTPGDAEGLLPHGEARRKVILTLVALVAVTALLDVIGYRIAVAVFSAALLYALGARSLWVIIVFALAAGFGVHALFSDLLKVPLPVGLFDI